jgi:hypothetical protein
MGRHPARFEKRRKELERVESQKEKAKRKAERKEASQSRPEGGDPDIDWIVPGPQPPPDFEGTPGEPPADED